MNIKPYNPLVISGELIDFYIILFQKVEIYKSLPLTILK
jgi:hypothetical protein